MDIAQWALFHDCTIIILTYYDTCLSQPKSRKEQRTKNVVIGDNGVEQTNLFTVSFDKVLDITSKRKQASKFTSVSIVVDDKKMLIHMHVCTV